MINYVGFDKDGTIIDSIPGYTAKWGEIILRDFGVSKEIAEDIFAIEAEGKPTVEQLSLVLQQTHIKMSEKDLFRRANDIALEIAASVKANAFPDVKEAFKKLKEHGCMIFVSSGQQEAVVVEDLTRTGLMEFVDFYAGIKSNKPDFKKGGPQFKAAANKFGVDFEVFCKETAFVGDTLVDVNLAKEFGIISIIRGSQNNLGADFIVSDFTGLYKILT